MWRRPSHPDPSGNERRRVLAEGEDTADEATVHPVLHSVHTGTIGTTPQAQPEAPTVGGTVAEVSPDPLVESSEAVDHLLDELRMCIRYYSHLHPNRPVDRLIFTGGEAKRVTLCQHLARSLRIKAQLGDPFTRLQGLDQPSANQGPHPLDLDQPHPDFTLPLGVCLSESNL